MNNAQPVWNFANFTPEEFACQHCGAHGIDLALVAKIQTLREKVDMPLVITSGYRCPDHPLEQKKRASGRPLGAHTEGCAADIGCSGSSAHRILRAALALGFTRIGVNMRGAHHTRFIHLDISTTRPSPALWSY